MVVPPSSGGAAVASSSTRPGATASNAASTKPKSTAHTPSAAPTSAPVPLSARRSEALDLDTVERRGKPNAAPETIKRHRLHNIPEGPTFRPTEEEFRDPMEYMRKIAPEGAKYGIAKIIPPDGWEMPFAIDTTKFHFRVRRQELNSVEGGTRANLNYLDQLSKFHRQHGTNLNRFPSVDKRPLDLYKLKKAVEARGGFDKVCKLKKWAEIGRDLGYSGKIMSSLSTSLKNSYQRWLQPYEDYLRVAKPGVQHQLELENGGPFTPSPGTSPIKMSQNNTPNGPDTPGPAKRATAALNASLSNLPSPAQQTPAQATPPAPISGFTPVNPGGFTAVNRPTSGFTPVNGPNGVHATPENPRSTPKTHLDSPHLADNITPNTKEGSGLKRPLSESAEKEASGDLEGRRSKRIKKESAPTVAGSNMHQPRTSTPRFAPVRERSNFPPGEGCETCGKSEDPGQLLICDSCDCGYHSACLDPPTKMQQPDHDWHCARCLVGTGEFGFEEGEVYSLKAFQEKANRFKENHFADKMPFDPIHNTRRPVNEDDVEREFWRLVENITETVEVEYGADIHSTTHGSGFPTIERNPRDPYSTDPWNLNVMPLYGESLFKHIKTDISGMTVPWLYVGMVFSTFCWHNEDHYAYSANYQHFGSTKTWYGVPGEDAEKFENAMREAVPELFETQPDLLFQLVTLMPPEKLKKAGVRVFAIDQRAGQFVITFPQAYHAGFNHGFNLNEAVNFAPVDWEPFGESGVQRLRDYRRQPCFSHDELLLTAASRDHSINTAKWLAPALERLLDKELSARRNFLEKPENTDPAQDSFQGERYAAAPEIITEELDEDDYICGFCKCFSFLSRYVCSKSGKVMCLLHAGAFECCDAKEADRYSSPAHDHVLSYRVTDKELKSLVQKVVDRAKLPEAWALKVDEYLSQEPRPSLKILRTLLNEGERIPYDIPQLADLKRYVEKCNDWVEEATVYITRKQQNRAKSGKSSRKNSAKVVAEMEERDKELRNFENMQKLLAAADEIHFDCPEYKTLRERETDINDFKNKATTILRNQAHFPRPLQEVEEVFELGKGLNIDLPELENLEKLLQHVKWHDEARNRRGQFQTLQGVEEFIQRGLEIGIAEQDPNITHMRELKLQGELWEAKAKEIMAVENVHYQQLDALSKQAAGLPVTPETLARVDAILKKQREAQEKILSLYQQSKNPDFRSRPMYKDVRDVMSALEELNSKPAGTVDLEKEQRRHEDWMRRGKKLFGKANAPLHILHQHMLLVKERNDSCFELRDKPRMPVEPSSREHTPERLISEGNNNFPDVFCLCRRPEAGMMIECELCHEWYHGKCLKIARGKVKEDDKYTCPICDWRLKIPRDAARPKLEELIAWQDELENLPFQPEEEDTLSSIIDTAQAFRDYIRPYVNPLTVSPDEVTTLRFYLRKVEGADILLAYETNFLRQELHKSAPVAPEAPPVIQFSSSTRKPRPTKQQKLMASLGITNPDDLPPQYKIKPHKRKGSEAHHKPPQPLQPAGSPAVHTPSSMSTATPGPPGSRPGFQQPPPSQQTPSFSYPNQNQSMVTSGYRDSPLFAPSFGLPPLRPQAEQSHTVNPAQFSHGYSAHTSPPPPPNFAVPQSPTHQGPMFGTSMNLDPALFGSSSSGAIMFDKRPGSSGSAGLVHDQEGPQFSSPRTSAANANLDSIFADMVHNDDDHATLGHEGENQLAGEAFAAGDHDQEHEGDDARMDEFVNN